jgi:hypothetical protein
LDTSPVIDAFQVEVVLHLDVITHPRKIPLDTVTAESIHGAG